MTNSNLTTSTDLDREFKQIPDDPEVSIWHIQQLIGAVFVGTLCSFGIILLILNADAIDGVDVIVQIVVLAAASALIGITWFVWRIKKMME